MKLCVTNGTFHCDAAGVTGELVDSCLTGGRHLGIGGLGGEAWFVVSFAKIVQAEYKTK